MTWNAQLTVQDDDTLVVVASATADETYDLPDHPAPGVTTKIPRLTSNTEGAVKAIEVRFEIEVGEPPLKIGDRISAYGHFTKTT